MFGRFMSLTMLVDHVIHIKRFDDVQIDLEKVQSEAMNDHKLTIEDLQREISLFCERREWDQFHNLKDLSISLTLETAELLEHSQWKNEMQLEEYLAHHKSEVADEVADVLYWTLLIANKLDIDLADAFQRKMAINEKKYPVAKSRGSSKKYTELDT
jgi:NTP pyrophosphatase (non-canonical NTP hydrolase)